MIKKQRVRKSPSMAYRIPAENFRSIVTIMIEAGHWPERWWEPLSRATSVNERTLRRWYSDSKPLPEDFSAKLTTLVITREFDRFQRLRALLGSN